MASKVTSNVIVPEALTKNNYEDWSFCMKNYLLAQNLWDIVEFYGPLTKKEDAKWTRKNATVLHALQISCAPEIFSQIRSIESARDAWSKLAEMDKQSSKSLRSGLHSIEGSDLLDASLSDISSWIESFVTGTSKGIERTTVLAFLSDAPLDLDVELNARFLVSIRITWLFFLVTHTNQIDAVKWGLGTLTLKDSETKDRHGNTLLANAVNLQTTKMAEVIIGSNPGFVIIPDSQGMIPVVKACQRRNKEMTKFLYSKTPLEFITSPENDGQGSLLLHFCLQSEMLDIALDLVKKHPRLAFTKNKFGLTPIVTLSTQPSLFLSGCELHFWQRWIYDCIKAEPIALPESVLVLVTDDDIKHQASCQSRGWTSILVDVFGFRNIYERKMIHKSVDMIIHRVNKELTTLNFEEMFESGIIHALFQTRRLGLTDDSIQAFYESNPDLVKSSQKFIQNMYVHAIEFRQDKEMKRISEIDRNLIPFRDKNNNNVLHAVAKLAPKSTLEGISGPALQMQRELQWLKRLESIVPECIELVNNNGETPRQVFSREHRKLVKEGQEWMKQAAQSYTFVAALIITIMFAVAFTIPGGSNQESGLPIFLHDHLFTAFILSDSIALSSSATSVLMFLGILTSRYGEDDFLMLLPTKLLIGIFTLLVSVTAMMVTFCAAVAMMLPGKRWRMIIIIVFACIPVVAFMLLQSRLLIEIFRSTYGPSILPIKKESSLRKLISALWNRMSRKLCACRGKLNWHTRK